MGLQHYATLHYSSVVVLNRTTLHYPGCTLRLYSAALHYTTQSAPVCYQGDTSSLQYWMNYSTAMAFIILPTGVLSYDLCYDIYLSLFIYLTSLFIVYCL